MYKNSFLNNFFYFNSNLIFFKLSISYVSLNEQVKQYIYLFCNLNIILKKNLRKKFHETSYTKTFITLIQGLDASYNSRANFQR